MPSPTIDYTVAAQDRTLGALRQGQAAVIEAVESWAKAVESATPDLPAIPVPASLPTVHELIQTSFDFYGKVLSAQREFAQDLVNAAAPAIKTTPVEVPSA